MGQTDLASNSLTSHPDVFADIVNAIIYKGDTVLAPEHLKPFYVNSTIAKNGKLKGLYRDNCMEDIRDGVRYVIWGLENQYVPDRTTPFKVMGYNYTAYDRQIEEYTIYNKENDIKTYVEQLLPEQKVKPVITLVLYYGKEEIPDSICAMMDIPENAVVRKYIQNYKLNLFKLRKMSKRQADRFHSDFQYIAKFLCAGYNKKELSKELRTSSQILTHTKDTLYTLASITGDQRYLTARKKYKEGSAVCEVAETLFQMGVAESQKELEQSKKKLEQNKKKLELNKKELAQKKKELKRKESDLAQAQNTITENYNTIAEKDSEIDRLRAEIEKLKQTQAGL